MRVIVCGGRNYNEGATVFDTLDRLHFKRPFSLVIHGGAPGADRLGGRWAIARRVPTTAVPADWCTHGKAAGPIRNQRMIDEGKPDLVVAFPGGRGTADMVRRAKAANIPVHDAGDAHDAVPQK